MPLSRFLAILRLNKLKSFSLVELLVAIAITLILAGTIALSVKRIGKPSAKSEAERLASYLIGLTKKYGSIRKNFDIEFDSHNQLTQFSVWPAERKLRKLDTYKMKTGCTFEWEGRNLELKYRYDTNTFQRQGGTFIIRDSENRGYYVIIYPIGGRIRTSSTSPKDKQNPE